MGQYKHIRGWIQLDAALYQLEKKEPGIKYGEFFERIQNWIAERDVDNEYFKTSFCLHAGTNSSFYLFIGATVKDYSEPYERLIKEFIQQFPGCYGVVSFNEADHEKFPADKIWLIKARGAIQETRTDYNFFGPD